MLIKDMKHTEETQEGRAFVCPEIRFRMADELSYVDGSANLTCPWSFFCIFPIHIGLTIRVLTQVQ